MTSETSGDDDAVTAPLPLLTALPDPDDSMNSVAISRIPPAARDTADPQPHPAGRLGPAHTGGDRLYEPASTDPAIDPFTPKQRRRGHRNWANGKVAVRVTGLIALILVTVVVLHFTGGEDQQDSATTTTSQPEAAPRAEDQVRLAVLLSPAFTAAMRCQPGDTNPSGTLASVHCVPRDQRPDAPADATYRLAGQKDNLDALLKAALNQTTVQLCPGNILSPGPWHLTSTPNAPAGTVFCGTRGDTAVVAWTDTDKLTFAEIRSAPLPSLTQPGPALAALYQWWQTNSYRH